MCKKTVYLLSFVLLLGSVSNAEDIAWTDLGADHLWSNPENWNLARVPTSADDVLIDVPAAAAPNGPVIQDGIAAEAHGVFTEAPGEPTLTITGGSLAVGDWIWLGDGADSFGVWTISGGTVDVADEFELGWGGGAGTLTVTGGTVNAGRAVIPTGSGAFGELFLYGGTYGVTKADGLQVNANGLIDITEGTLVLEGDDTAKVNDLIAAGQITAYGGGGLLKVDFDGTNAGKTTLTAVGRTVLLAEDFEGLPLGPNVDEALAGDAVWTDTPPEGWAVDESGIPGIGDPATDGVTEWAGWAFADKAWWTETAGDQDRSMFVLASGTVAVADPDEWDDAAHDDAAAAGWYKTFLTTPATDISGIEAGSLQLTFASSWRPEFDSNYHQTANITASFDGGDPVVVLLWESDEASASYKPYATNETVTVDLQNPAGAGSVVLTFGLFDAGNDWWWAIDNVEVSGIPLPEPVNPGADGLAASYALENDVLDSSGNGNDGTVTGVTAFVEGVAGMAMSFDGESYVDCGSGASLDITGAISMSLWIKPGADDPEGQGTATAPLAKAASGASPSWSWQVRYGWNSPQPYMAFTFNTSPRAWVYVGKNLERDEWTHIACSADGTTLSCYLDGSQTDSTPMGAITSSPTSLLIGSDGWRSDWIGAIDEVAIYNRALSDGEIRFLAGHRTNLALNPSFEEDEVVLDDPDWVGWATWNPAEGAGSNATIVDTDAADGTRSLRIEPIGPANWHFIVVNMPLATEVGTNYAASFWAKADATRPLGVQFKAADNSVSWGYADFELTTEWAEYTLTSPAESAETKLEFFCAAVEVPFLLDSLSVVEVE